VGHFAESFCHSILSNPDLVSSATPVKVTGASLVTYAQWLIGLKFEDSEPSERIC
jgi:hypothetical protein